MTSNNEQLNVTCSLSLELEALFYSAMNVFFCLAIASASNPKHRAGVARVYRSIYST